MWVGLVSAGLCLCFGSAASAQSLPTTVFGNGEQKTPTEAWGYYQGLPTGSLDSSPRGAPDSDVVETAAALGNDVDRIYAFVHDNIEVLPMFGLKAGARGALIDKAGTPVDQAHLMVELLRAAGYTASYELGTIKLSGTNFTTWMGVSNPAAAQKLLRDGGIPFTMTDDGTTITDVTLMHVWVKVTINNSPYVFDPAFKTHTVKAGVNLDTAMSFNAATFQANALVGSTPTSDVNGARIRGLNRANLQADLQTASANLRDYIGTNLPAGGIEDVVGSREINRYEGAALRQTSLASSSVLATFANDLPPALRTKVTVRFYSSGAQQHQFSWFADQIYGQELYFKQIDDKAPSEPEQFTFSATGSTLYPGMVGAPSIEVDHPYAAKGNIDQIAGHYMDRTMSVTGATTGAVQLMLGFGKPSPDFGAWQEDRSSIEEGWTNRDFTAGNPEPGPLTVESAQIATRRRMAAAYMAQLSEAADMVGAVGKGKVQVHDILGFVTAAPYPGNTGPLAATSFHIGVEAGVSATADDGSAAGAQAAQRTMALMVPALEGSLAEQIGDSVYPGSTPVKLDWAVDGPANVSDRLFYRADSSNWNWVKSQILNDFDDDVGTPTSPVKNAAEAYINQGYTVLIPRSSDLGPGPETFKYCRQVLDGAQCSVQGPDRGGAFIAIGPNGSGMAHIIAKQYGMSKGGGGTNDAEVDPGRVFAVPEQFQKREFTTKAMVSAVDLKTGKLTYTPPADIVVGAGEYPYNLSFQRSFRSGYRGLPSKSPYDTSPTPPSDNAVFGHSGWSSNLRNKFDLSTGGLVAFGHEDPRTATSTVAAVRAMLAMAGDGSSGVEQLERQLISNMAANWWTQSLRGNTMTLLQGQDSRSFIKLVRRPGETEDTWLAPGRDETIKVEGERYLQTPLFGPQWWDYRGVCVKLTGSDRSVSWYGPWDSSFSNCTPVTPSSATIYRPNYTGIHFKKQVFPYGVVVERTADGLQNNLGRKLIVSSTFGEPGFVDATISDSEDPSRVVNVDQNSGPLTFSDTTGQVWTYAENSGFEVRPPSTPTVPFVKYVYGGGVGKVASVTDGNGNTTTFKIGAGRIGAVTNPLGDTTRTEYDRHGQPIAITEPIDVVNGVLRTRTTRTEYDGRHRKRIVTAPGGDQTTYEYDPRHNVTKTTRIAKPGSNLDPIVTSAEYHSYFNVPTKEIDALGQTTTHTYNATTGLIETSTQPVVQGGAPLWTYTWNGFGQRLTKTDPTGVKLRYVYDSKNRLSQVVAADGALNLTSTFGYDAAGNITSLDAPRLDVIDVTNATWNAARQLTVVVGPDPDGAGPLKRPATRYTYDVDGQLVKTEKGTATTATASDFVALQTVTLTYDPDGNKVKQVTPAGVTQFSYDPVGRPTCTAVRMNPAVYTSLPIDACILGPIGADGPDRITKTEYDKAGQAIKIIRALGVPQLQQDNATYTYTLSGKQDTVADANGNLTTFVYDGFDRLCKQRFPVADEGATGSSPSAPEAYCPEPGEPPATYACPPVTGPATPGVADYEAYCYDANGNRLTLRKRDGSVIAFTYDGVNRETLQDLPAGTASDVVTEYDLAGRKRHVRFGVASNSGVFNAVTDCTAPGGGVDYCYDAAGRPVREYSFGRQMTFEYGDLVNRTRVIWPDGFYATYAYDALNRPAKACENVTAATCALSATDTLLEGMLASFGYDPSGRRASLTRGNTTSTTYGYDVADRLTSLTHDLPLTADDLTWTFGYNPASQTTSRTASNDAYAWLTLPGETNFTRDGLNRDKAVAAVEGGYDRNGNQRKDGANTFDFDVLNRLTTVTGPQALSLTYDPLGRLRQTTSGSTATQFLYDGDRLVAEYDGAGSLLRRYVHGTGVDEPLVWYEGAGTTDRRFLHVDRQGSVIAQSDKDGLVTRKYAYGPYGQPGDNWAVGGSRFRYTGQIALFEAQLYHYKARVYDPGLGRFLQTDPIGYQDDLDLYAYTGNDPTNGSDPTGLYDCVSGHACGASSTRSSDGIDLKSDEKSASSSAKTEVRTQNTAQMGAAQSPRDICGWNCTREQAEARRRTEAAMETNWWLAIPALAPEAAVGVAEFLTAGTIRGAAELFEACNCFEAGTPVETIDGYVSIEDLKAGDLVLSRSDETGEVAYRPIVAPIPGASREIWDLVIESRAEDGRTQRETIHTTEEHPFRTASGDWMPASRLSAGDRLVTADANAVEVISIRNSGRVSRTYNLEVSEFHTYFVGKQRVWVHNSCAAWLRRLGNLASRAGENAGDVALSRGATASNVRKMGPWADKPLGEVAQAAQSGDSSAQTALKIVKEARRLAQKPKGS